jgi:hypothetical protein
MESMPSTRRAKIKAREMQTCIAVAAIGFKLLYCFVFVRINRRELIWIDVTTNPTAEWIARQIT